MRQQKKKSYPKPLNKRFHWKFLRQRSVMDEKRTLVFSSCLLSTFWIRGRQPCCLCASSHTLDSGAWTAFLLWNQGQQKAQVLPSTVADIQNQMSSIEQHRMNGLTLTFCWVRQETSQSQSALLVLSSILAEKKYFDDFKLVPTGVRVDAIIHTTTHRVILVMIKEILLVVFLSSANT